MATPVRILLASKSPRRAELMHDMGLSFEIVAEPTDETCSGAAQSRVMTLAKRKALAVYTKYPDCLVIGADTLVESRNEVLGKPKDAADAARMMRLLSGGWHQVYSGVCVLTNAKEQVQAVCTRVKFADLDDQLIARYIATGEPMDKAGAYAIQGRGGMLVEEIAGSYSNVVGLPTAALRVMLNNVGVEVLASR